MRNLGHRHLLLAAFSVLLLHQGILMEFKDGFLLFGCSSPAFIFFGLFFMFMLGLKVLTFTWSGKNGLIQLLCDFRVKSCNDPNRVCSENCPDENSGSKFESCKCNPEIEEEFDVLELRRLVKVERRRGDAATAELEKERMAAATAADEAMAMILRLQNEKSAMEIEANRHRRLAGEIEEFYQEVILSLRWNIMELESEIRALEEMLEQKGH